MCRTSDLPQNTLAGGYPSVKYRLDFYKYTSQADECVLRKQVWCSQNLILSGALFKLLSKLPFWEQEGRGGGHFHYNMPASV